MKTTGSVQEKNGRFYFVINLYDANGKRKIKWISTGLTVRGNKRKAESMLREVLLHYDETGELPTGRGGTYEKVDAKTAKPLPLPLQPVNKSEMLFLDYLNEWVQVHKASIQPATFISYNRMITGRITQYFEPLGLKLCEVTPQVLDEFQEKILLEGYTTNTVIHYHAIFGKAFKDAVRKDYLETNPMLKVDRPKKNSFRPNFYSKDEVQQLLEVSQDDPLHLCILITAYYGLRRSEVLGLKWSSIDFERKSITINHKVTEQLVNGKYVPVVSDVMKNKTSCRTLPLIPAVEEELLKQKEKQQLYRKLFKKSYSTEYLDFVCTDQEGKLIRPNFVTEHFDWLLTKYGLKHIRFHDLRHSCASLMVMNGVSMKQVQEWLGHSTFSTTADIYAHLDYKSKQGVCWGHCEPSGRIQAPQIIMDLSFIYKAYCDEEKAVFLCLMQKKKSQVRLNLRLLAEMVGFEPTCPIKDKTISSRSRYDRFDTSPSIFSWQIYDLYIANRP